MDRLKPSGLLPSSIKDERYIILDKLISRLDHIELEVVLTCFIDKVADSLLYTLAEQFHLLGSEGWFSAETPAQRRALIKRAVMLHRKRGTKWAIKYVLDVMGLDGRMMQWFEKTPPSEPYTFDLNIDLLEKPLSYDHMDKLLKLIDTHKNARSWLHLHLERLERGTVRIGGAAFGRVNINKGLAFKTLSGGIRVGGAAQNSVNIQMRQE